MNNTGLPGVALDDREHVCVFHRGAEERDAVLSAFFRAGYAEGDKCLHIADDHDSAAVAARLDPQQESGPGQLTVLPATAYLTDGRFEPERAYTQWHTVIGGYIDSGYRHVRGTGELSWFLRHHRSSGGDAGPLLEYEALCNRLVKRRPATIFCFYDLDLLDADLLPGVLHHHPAALARGVLFRSWRVEERPGGANEALLLANQLLGGARTGAEITALLEGLRRSVLDDGARPGTEGQRFLATLPGLADPHRRAVELETAQLARALLDGTPSDAAGDSRLRALGLDLDAPRRVAVVRPPVDRAELDRVMAAGIGLAASRGGETALVATDGEVLNRVVEELATGPGRTVGLGRARTGDGGITRSYAEARQAADFAAALARPAVRHEDLGLFSLLAGNGDTGPMTELVAEWLGPLLAHDERRRQKLLPTLAAYLDAGAAQQATADALGVHVSTLKYRLGRIEEVTGRDLSAPDVRFQLQVALAAHRTLSVLSQDV